MSGMPSCWTSADDWRWWNKYNALACGNRPLDNFCADCTPAFKRNMQAAGRCEHPTVTFVRITEYQNDPRLMTRKEVVTNAVRGVRYDKT